MKDKAVIITGASPGRGEAVTGKFADEVAEVAYETAPDGKMERITGGSVSVIMTTMGYLFPRAKRLIKPLLVSKGKRVKQKIPAQQDALAK